MIIDCISDLHGFYPTLEGGDLLIVAGDLTAQDLPTEYNVFADWIKNQPYKKRIVIGGNHDYWLQCAPCTREKLVLIGEFEYLCDSSTEFGYTEPVNNPFDPNDRSLVYRKKIKIYGSPWTKTFPGMNPKCKAFTLDTEEELAEKWALIPEDTDILVTHSPPNGVLDLVDFSEGDSSAVHVGSKSLSEKIGKIKPRLHVFGHIHENGGEQAHFMNTRFVNASHVNENYDPVNKPVRIEL